ncbi:hypothetical protein WR25_15255 [Diploscapter pachys]|uniref:C2H2-type domain-containing protein n=1 Tax=Diploscapter pachys TaxID=2018661 RepID=A0A2A2LUS9_9BILA|nr:hypothetical protein WR25_15255 [Diploscapter pachys]
MDSNRKVRSCPECKTELLTRNFFAHLRNVHCWDEEKINEQKQKSQKQLNSPMSVSISTTSLPSESDSSHSTDKSEGIFCPADDCDYVYDNSVNLAIHWQQEHCSDDIQAEEYGIHEKLFTSLDDFEKWKMTAETAACVKWIRRSSREGNIYFKCSRAGTYRSESNGLRVGHETKKATRICTSFCIVSSLCPGSVLATFCLGHAGHIADVAKLPFNEAEQKFIEQLIKTGKHTISTAIDFLRSNQTPDMPRLYFTTRQDIRNIMDMLNIVPGKRCENDLISLKIRAEEEGTAGGFRFLQFPNSVTGDEFILGNA